MVITINISVATVLLVTAGAAGGGGQGLTPFLKKTYQLDGRLLETVELKKGSYCKYTLTTKTNGKAERVTFVMGRLTDDTHTDELGRKLKFMFLEDSNKLIEYRMYAYNGALIRNITREFGDEFLKVTIEDVKGVAVKAYTRKK